MIGYNNSQLPITILTLILVVAVALEVVLIVVALKSDRPSRNLILVLLLGVIAVPLISNKSEVRFDDQANLEEIKLRLAKELSLSAREAKSDRSIISDLRIVFPYVEAAVSFVSSGYGIDPSLIIIEKDSTIEELANQISDYHSQDPSS